MLRVFVKNYDEPLFAEYSCFGGCKGKMYLNNGDPGYPDEPPEIDTISVSFVEGGPDVYELLSDAVRDQIEAQCLAEESEHDD